MGYFLAMTLTFGHVAHTKDDKGNGLVDSAQNVFAPIRNDLYVASTKSFHGDIIYYTEYASRVIPSS